VRGGMSRFSTSLSLSKIEFKFLKRFRHASHPDWRDSPHFRKSKSNSRGRIGTNRFARCDSDFQERWPAYVSRQDRIARELGVAIHATSLAASPPCGGPERHDPRTLKRKTVKRLSLAARGSGPHVHRTSLPTAPRLPRIGADRPRAAAKSVREAAPQRRAAA
jgi:hypothetical protein